MQLWKTPLTTVHLAFIGILILITHRSQAQTNPVVIPSTNYVATGCSLKVQGSGFTTNEIINVFVSGYHSPMCEICTDSNGCFKADLTFGGTYLTPDVQYWLSPSVDGPIYFTVHYQAAEAQLPWKATVPIIAAHPLAADPTGQTMFVTVTCLVGRGGHAYQVQWAPTPSGPWEQFMGRIMINDTWTDNAEFRSDFTTSGMQGYFRIADPTTF